METNKRIEELAKEVEARRNETAELMSLLRSMKMINSSLDLYTVLDHLMELATELTRSEAASALLVEDERLCFVAASGVKSSEVKQVYLDKGEGIAGWVALHGKELIIDDVARDARFTRRVDSESGFVTRSVLAVPLKIERRVIGVVEAVNKIGGGGFSESDVQRLSSLADSAAMAIHKARLYGDVNELFMSTITAITNAIEAKDVYTRGHSERIRRFSLVIMQELGLGAAEQKSIELGALLHDVGKIGVPEAVLCKNERLTDAEFDEIKRHPVIGAEMLASIKQLKDAIPAIRYHQERYDGKGYPEGLAGESIPLGARIIAVADTFDAMTSNRAYRSALPDTAAVEEIERHAGRQFDPACARAFVNGYRKGLVRSQGASVAETHAPSDGPSAGLGAGGL